jgi:flagellar P-ring protein precursor FlgI
MAQGPVAIAGFSAGGKDAKTTKNHQTAGKISSGALIEKEVPLIFAGKDDVTLMLKSPDFTTAERMATAINDGLGRKDLAVAIDAGKLVIKIPGEYRDDLIGFIARLESMDIRPDSVTKVVINERTGTVVMGENVRISTVAISHGDISIEVKTQYQISQPPPFSRGSTVVQPVEETDVQEERSRLIVLPESVTLGDVVRALNLVGVTPRDLVAILQAIKAAGALQADLEVI